MGQKFLAVLCSLTALSAGCSSNQPFTSNPILPGSAIDGTPYYIPKAFLRVTFDPAKASSVDLEIENKPDVTRGYVAEVGFSAFSTDLSVIETNSDGLLTSVTLDTDEQSDDFVETLTTRISAIAAGTDQASFNVAEDIGFQSLLFDPFDPELVGDGKTLGNGIKVQRVLDDQATPNAFNDDTRAVSCPSNAAICVPLLVPVRLKIRIGNAIFDFYVSVAHPTHVIGIQLNRKACVQTKSVLTLRAGVMMKYDVNKPSEAVGCLSIPLDVISAIVAAPVNALTGRQARFEAEKKLIMEQQALLTERRALIEAQEAALEAP